MVCGMVKWHRKIFSFKINQVVRVHSRRFSVAVRVTRTARPVLNLNFNLAAGTVPAAGTYIGSRPPPGPRARLARSQRAPPGLWLRAPGQISRPHMGRLEAPAAPTLQITTGLFAGRRHLLRGILVLALVAEAAAADTTASRYQYLKISHHNSKYLRVSQNISEHFAHTRSGKTAGPDAPVKLIIDTDIGGGGCNDVGKL
eukprot:SAG31_NODE_3882_length_3789_cov_1.497561_3_plen_200_part_00